MIIVYPDSVCYTLFKETTEFSEARNRCESVNNSLAVIETEEELNMIKQKAINKNFK